MNFDDLFLFVRVIERGSFAQAALELAMPSSTLSRRIQQLEQRLGYQLMYRSARKLSLTEAGTLFFNRCQPLFDALQASTAEVSGELTAPKGRLKVTAPVNLAKTLLNPWLFAFMERYPAIEVDLVLTNGNIDLKEEGIDVAFRIGDVRIQDWVSRKLLTSQFTLCAAPTLIERCGRPESLAQLEQMPLLISRRIPTWQLTDHKGKTHRFTGQPRLLYDELQVAVDAAVAGLGVANLPSYACQQALDQGRLEAILPALKPAGREVHIVYPHRQFLATKARLFIDFFMAASEQYR